MEKTMLMPAYYNVMSQEEMTYTEGGATLTEALLNWIPPVGWYLGVMAVRDYRKKNPNSWVETGLDALSRDMNRSPENLIRDAGRTFWFVGSCATGVGLVINAALILL